MHFRNIIKITERQILPAIRARKIINPAGTPLKEIHHRAPWDPYQILEIERGASQENIKQAFRQLAGKYHPDKVEYLGDEFKALAEKRFKEIQRAYEELKRE